MAAFSRQWGFDIGSEIVPLNENNLCYKSINNEIILLSKNGSAWLESRALVGKKVTNPILHCAGNIKVDKIGRIWFLSTDNKIKVWTPSTGILTTINTSYSVSSFEIAECGCLIFYRTQSNGLVRQIQWSSGWNEFSIPSVEANVTYGNMVLDESKSRLYYISNSSAVYQYTYNYATPNLNGLFKLGNQGEEDSKNNKQLCSLYDNALAGLTLSPNKDMLYYVGTDFRIWYFFNDKENSEKLPQGQVVPVRVSKENWNKTPLQYSVKSNGPLAFEPAGNNSRLFYAGSDQKLNFAMWANADNMLNCPYDAGTGGYFVSNAYRLTDTMAIAADKMTLKEVAIVGNTTTNISIQVFPNPSDHTFTFNITRGGDNNANIEILISDITGSTIEVLRENKTTIKWDASKIPNGVYFYYCNVLGNVIKGKLIKM